MTEIDWSFVDTMHEPEKHSDVNYMAQLRDLRNALLDLEEVEHQRRSHDDHDDGQPPRKLVAGCADCVARVKWDQEIAALEDAHADDIIEAFMDEPFDLGDPIPYGRYQQALQHRLLDHDPSWGVNQWPDDHGVQKPQLKAVN